MGKSRLESLVALDVDNMSSADILKAVNGLRIVKARHYTPVKKDLVVLQRLGRTLLTHSLVKPEYLNDYLAWLRKNDAKIHFSILSEVRHGREVSSIKNLTISDVSIGAFLMKNGSTHYSLLFTGTKAGYHLQFKNLPTLRDLKVDLRIIFADHAFVNC